MSRNYSIGHICPSTAWGGLEMNVHRLAVWLTERGWSNILYGFPGAPLYEACQRSGVAVRELPSKSKFGDFFLARNLSRQIKRDNARVIINHMNKNFLLAVLAKRHSGNFFKLLYDQHMHVGGNRRDLYHSWVYGHLDYWLVPLPMFIRALTEKTSVPPGKIKTVPHAIVLDHFTDNPSDKAVARQRLRLPEDAILAGVIGRIDPKKCQHVLIDAAGLLHKKGIPLHLLIIGDKSLNEEAGYEEQVYRQVEQLGLGEFVHFRPYMSDIEHGYAAMDIFTLTSKSETYGMVTIEAMASQLPVVGTNDGGTTDIIDDGANGLLVEPLDPSALADAIGRLIADPELARRLAEQARRDAFANYSHHRQCELLEEIFDSFDLSD